VSLVLCLPLRTALCFVSDYYPGSFTLAQRYFPAASSKRPAAVSAPDESVLWSYIVQLVSALSSVHLAGLSLRGALDTRRIILTDTNRIRVTLCGVADALLTSAAAQQSQSRPKSLLESQYDDIYAFGKTILTIATLNDACLHNIPYGRTTPTTVMPMPMPMWMTTAEVPARACCVMVVCACVRVCAVRVLRWWQSAILLT
jgi:hypothetical protein